MDPPHVELDDPALVSAAIGAPSSSAKYEWPPRSWAKPKFGAAYNAEALVEVKHLLFSGPCGFKQARAGARNKIAGMTARSILRRGGTLEDFRAWDSMAMNKERTGIDTVVELEPARRIVIQRDPGTVTTRGVATFTSVSSGTRVNLVLDAKLRGMAKLFAFKIRPAMNSGVKASLQNLKWVLEANPSPS